MASDMVTMKAACTAKATAITPRNTSAQVSMGN
jgi:hypothetical protein